MTHREDVNSIMRNGICNQINQLHGRIFSSSEDFLLHWFCNFFLFSRCLCRRWASVLTASYLQSQSGVYIFAVRFIKYWKVKHVYEAKTDSESLFDWSNSSEAEFESSGNFSSSGFAFYAKAVHNFNRFLCFPLCALKRTRIKVEGRKAASSAFLFSPAQL